MQTTDCQSGPGEAVAHGVGLRCQCETTVPRVERSPRSPFYRVERSDAGGC